MHILIYSLEIYKQNSMHNTVPGIILIKYFLPKLNRVVIQL